MPIKPFKVVPQDAREWARFLQQTEVAPSPGSVGPDELADHSVTLSKLEVANANGKFLVKRGGAMTYDFPDDGDIPGTIARQTDVAAAIAAAAEALDEHVDAPDPHPVYITSSELTGTLTDYYTKTASDARFVLTSNVLAGSKTYDPPDLAAGAVDITTVTVTGAAAGDFALASHGDVSTTNADKVGLVAKVTATNTVSVTFRNDHSANVDLASATLRVRVWKQ